MGKHKKVQVWEKYDVENGEVKRGGRSCPRCGEGVFLGEHDNRLTCGRCGFSEIKEG